MTNWNSFETIFIENFGDDKTPKTLVIYPVERLVVEILVFIELLKYWLSLMSTLEHEVNNFHVKVN